MFKFLDDFLRAASRPRRVVVSKTPKLSNKGGGTGFSFDINMKLFPRPSGGRKKASPKGMSLRVPKSLPITHGRNDPLVSEARITPRNVSKVFNKIMSTSERQRRGDFE